MRLAALAGLALAGVAVGLVAERQAYEWTELSSWLPDLLAGWTLIGLGIALLALRRPAGAAALLLLAGFTWYAFNYDSTGPGATERLAEQAAYLHRGPILALALALPNGRPRGRAAAAGVALAWTAAVVWPLWDLDVAALLVSAAFVAIATVERVQATGRRGRTLAGRGLAAVVILVAAVAAGAMLSLTGADQGPLDAAVLGYAVAVALAGAILFSAAILAAPAVLAEQVVALERGGARLRDALRDVLGDPELELAYEVGPGRLVDDRGRPFGPTSRGRVTTPVAVAGQQVGVVVHDPATLDDAATRSAVLAAVGLSAERARLQEEVARRVELVEASRRRLLAAEDDERRRLAERLDRGPGAQLAHVDRLLRDAPPNGDGQLAAALGRAAEQLGRIRPELLAFVDGLGGVGTSGLGPALTRLAAGLPIPVQLELAEVEVPSDVASALWFVCSESLANAVKHGDAGTIRVALAVDGGAARLTVADDGRGGANPSGSGLVGLADRVAALGGRLQVHSPLGGGTRVDAVLPLALASAGSSR